ncbi:helix-turn-helix domain-containing protein [Rhodococcus koreensis]
MTEHRYLTCAEVAERWQLSARQVQRMATRGELTHMRMGKSIRIPARAVEQFERVRTNRAE